MARVQTNVQQEALRIEFKLREPYSVELDEKMVPVVIVSDLTNSLGSRGYPRLARGFANPLAVAAQTAQAQVVGILNAGKIFHITAASVFSAAAQDLALRVNDPAVDLAGATNVTTKDWLDRGVGGGIPDLAVSTLTSATVFGRQIGRFRLAANISLFIKLDVLLRGADFCAITAGTVNTALAVSWEWTEYLLEDR